MKECNFEKMTPKHGVNICQIIYNCFWKFSIIERINFRSLMQKISFIKIDIEGYEYKALIGLKNTIINDSPIIALEQWTDAFDEIKKTTKSIDFLKKNLYKFFYEPVYFRRKKNKNKILRAINKIIFFLQILFDSKKINLSSTDLRLNG